MPSLVAEEKPDRDNDNEDEDEEGDNGASPSQSSIPLTVNINKGQGPSLEFICTGYADEIVIDAMSVREDGLKNDQEETLAYEGPDFSDLDENLQKAFHKYLELRGITPITTNFLHEYMINKDSCECLRWLENLKEVEEIPEGVSFEIKDEKGKNIITLKGKYQDEDIEITVFMPSLVTGEEPDRDNANEEGGNGASPSQHPIHCQSQQRRRAELEVHMHCLC